MKEWIYSVIKTVLPWQQCMFWWNPTNHLEIKCRWQRTGPVFGNKNMHWISTWMPKTWYKNRWVVTGDKLRLTYRLPDMKRKDNYLPRNSLQLVQLFGCILADGGLSEWRLLWRRVSLFAIWMVSTNILVCLLHEQLVTAGVRTG